ncbi:MAG: hypothetical protein WC455_29660 [Dehalococcoidia bacterium]|jgi:hypothetical protein
MEATAAKSESGSGIPRLEAKGTQPAVNSVSKPEDKSVSPAPAALPWLCQTCEKTYPACGKSIGQCESALFRANEYERGHA